MKITLNLATRPFVELRPLFARLRLAMGALVLLAILLGIGLHMLTAKAATAQARMDALKTRTAAFEQERLSNESRMHQPRNMSVLDRSQLLNALFAQKSFSWTAVMMDLENVLPAGVQVVSIDPSITKEGEVLIRLRVSGERDRAVQLVRNLETSRRFLAPRLSNESAQTQDSGGGLAGGPRGVPTSISAAAAPPGVEFDILSGYNPLPSLPAKAAAVKAAKPAGLPSAKSRPAKKGCGPMSQTQTAPQPSLHEQARVYVTPLNLHIAGVGLLVLVNLYLLIHMGFAWQAERSQDEAAVAQQTSAMHAAERAAAPLRGLDGKLTEATKEADSFSARRLPFAFSQVLAEMGKLKGQGVKLTRVGYAETPLLTDSAGALTEVRMDASLTGDYRPLVVFMNNLERDRMFFLITGVALTGQQSGTVNLRIKLNTYLRAPIGDETAAKAVPIDGVTVQGPDAGEEPQ